MNPSTQLHADLFARAVQAMRDLQKQRTPGCPLAIRRAIEAAEAEVDELLAVRALWCQPEPADQEHDQ